jgi:hypothetical protein
MKRDSRLRRTHRLAAGIDRALATMQAGQNLHLQHRNGHALWHLSDGRPLAAEAAAILIRNAHVVPADSALFPDLPGQTWRHR